MTLPWWSESIVTDSSRERYHSSATQEVAMRQGRDERNKETVYEAFLKEQDHWKNKL